MMFRYLTSFSRRCYTRFKAVYGLLLLLIALNFFLITLYFFLRGELHFKFTREVETPSPHLTSPTTMWSSLSPLKQRRGSKNGNSSNVFSNLSDFSYGHAKTLYIVELLCAITVTYCLLTLLRSFSISILSFRFKTEHQLSSSANNNYAGVSSQNSFIDSKEFEVGGLSFLVTIMVIDSKYLWYSIDQSPKNMNGSPISRTSFPWDDTNAKLKSLSFPYSEWRRSVPFQTSSHSKNGNETIIPSVLNEFDELKARYSQCKAGDHRKPMRESYQRLKNREAPVHTQDLSLKTEIMQLQAAIGAKNAEIQNLASTVKTLAAVRKAQSRDAEIRALNGIIETLLTNI